MNPTTKPSDTTTPRRVRRGGGWYSNQPSWVRAASRFTSGPAFRDDDFGFRCALRGREPRT